MSKRKGRLDLESYYAGIIAQDRLILSRAITLIESELFEDRELATKLLDKCLPHTGDSYRIGITGVPGVGKSTFINTFGEYLLEKGRTIAVLAVDPSSTQTRGSILGDKTRMNNISQDPRAFVRPSPTSGSLGGVTKKTRETLLLCEAAGFDTIIVETVGVGQSELAVKSMVDFFLLLMLPNAGDELQGIKKGIMEMADTIFVNKSDGDFQSIAQKAKGRYAQALKLKQNNEEWKVRVLTGSGLHKTGLKECWEALEAYKNFQIKTDGWNNKRKKQSIKWLEESIETYLLYAFKANLDVQQAIEQAKHEIHDFSISPDLLASNLIKDWVHIGSKKRE